MEGKGLKNLLSPKVWGREKRPNSFLFSFSLRLKSLFRHKSCKGYEQLMTKELLRERERILHADG